MGDFLSNIQKGFNDNIACPFYKTVWKPIQDKSTQIAEDAKVNAPTLMLIASPPPSKD